MEDYDIIETKETSQKKNNSIILEYINEFSSVKLDSEEKEITMMVHIKAPKIENINERKKNLRISAVIDVSGSMNGEKLELAKESLMFMVNELSNDDEFGIVAFESNVDIVLPIVKLNKENKELALYKIKEMKTGGCTNLSGGLFTGIEQIRSNLSNNTINSILLFTDGQANNGISKPQPLLSELNKRIDNKNDHVIYTFGFGEDHNGDLLRKISEAGYGMYSFIQNTSAMKEIFTNCLAGLMSVVAQNLKLVVTPCESIEVVKVWTKFNCEKEGTSTIVSIKDLFSEESRDILVILKGGKISGKLNDNMSLAKFTLTYDNILTGVNDSVNLISTIKLSNEESNENSNLILDEQRNRMIMLEELEKANLEAEKGEIENANERINLTRNRLFASPSGKTGYTTGILNDLNNIQQVFANREEYASKGSKIYSEKISSHVAQRCNAVLSDSDSDECDNNENKKDMKEKKVKSTAKMYCNSIQKNMQKKSRK
jgi:uncharacterized protein YegL